ncbi:MAG TPA: LysR family transcriptional regulator [Stellaceae bacterium]|nr:LysR family transcriptional regulator [Stellaceae bacterium]
MKSRFDDILTFLQVVEAGGITAAAVRLNISKSVVSKRIGELESRLGAELLRRSTRRVVPTDRGAAFYEKMRALVAEFDNAVEQASLRTGALQGRLRITAPMSFGTAHLGPVLAAFARRHPGLELALDLDDRIVDLVDNGYDMAIRIGRLRDSSLVARKLCLSRRIVCCSPDYARERGLPASIEDLSAHPCIDYAHVQAGRLWQFEPSRPGGTPRAVTARSRITANNGEIMRDMALAGLGLAVLPLFIVHEQLRQGTLVNALPAAVPLADTIYAVYPPTRYVSRRVRALIDHLAAALGGTPPWERTS